LTTRAVQGTILESATKLGIARGERAVDRTRGDTGMGGDGTRLVYIIALCAVVIFG
jgi:hypothetical protein